MSLVGKGSRTHSEAALWAAEGQLRWRQRWNYFSAEKKKIIIDLNSIKTSRGRECSLKQPPRGALLVPDGYSSCAQVVQGTQVSRWQLLSKAGLKLAHQPQSLLAGLRACSPSSHPGWTIISTLKGGQK